MIKEGLQNSQLNPKIHEYFIISQHGRLKNVDIPDDSINPILLPKKRHSNKTDNRRHTSSITS